MTMRPFVAFAGAILLGSSWFAGAQAYEADVHFGLTKWLAQKAGFESIEAELIALGNQRVDSGAMESVSLGLDYACGRKDPGAALEFARLHFPSDASVFAPARDRTVAPGSPAARRAANDLLALAGEGRVSQFLLLFGASLHTLQDSWSHAGAPGSAEIAAAGCDAALMWGHSVSPGGPQSHAADLTGSAPVGLEPMAMATYAYLKTYPVLNGRQRQAAGWDQMAPELEQFARAATKTEKRQWFLSHDMTDTNFLEGITLPDGPDPGPLKFTGRALPELSSSGSTQWDAAEDVRSFFDQVIERWLSEEKLEDVVGGLAGPRRRELLARMKLWKIQDHGRAASLAHAPSPLTARQLAAADAMARAPDAYVRAKTTQDAFFPLVAAGKKASALLPYVVRTLEAADPAKPERVIAVARLKHAPYDTVGWIAERAEHGWILVDMVSLVDH